MSYSREGSGSDTMQILHALEYMIDIHYDPVAKVPVSLVKALAGTPAPIALVGSETYVTSFSVEAARADGPNSGDVFIGLISDLVSGTKNYFRLSPGKVFSYTCRAGTKLNLALWGIDGETATDGVIGVYEPV